MSKLIDFFISGYKHDDYLTQKLAKSLTIIVFLGIVIDILYLISNIIFTHNVGRYNLNFLKSPIAFLIIFIVTLYLIKIHRLRAAGNFSLTALIIIESIISFMSLKNQAPYSFTFAGTYYYMLMLLGISVFFTSNFFLSLNTVLTIVSSLLNLFVVKQYAPAHVLAHLKTATLDFITTTLALYGILLLSKNIVKSSFTLLSKEKNEKEKQNTKLTEIFKGIKLVITELDSLSKILNNISKLIVERSVQQASSTEQVAVTAQKINSIIAKTYDLARQTKDNAAVSYGKYLKSKQILEETIESFLNIIKQIKNINEFAEKTEILAINAAIEAAHASEIASGFSVIAQEIRKLSDSIKQHSKRISQTAQISKKKSSITLNEFNELTTEIQTYTNFIKKITEESQLLFENIKQIYQQTSVLSEYSEKNSSLAQTLQKSAQQLSEISEKLKNMINSI